LYTFFRQSRFVTWILECNVKGFGPTWRRVDTRSPRGGLQLSALWWGSFHRGGVGQLRVESVGLLPAASWRRLPILRKSRRRSKTHFQPIRAQDWRGNYWWGVFRKCIFDAQIYSWYINILYTCFIGNVPLIAKKHIYCILRWH
jgi:hypothetical protein